LNNFQICIQCLKKAINL